MGHDIPSIAPNEAFKIGSFVVTETMVSTTITALVIILFAIVVRVFFIPKWAKEHEKKSGFRLLLEYLVNMFDSTAWEKTGSAAPFVGMFYFGSSAFICIGILLEMFGFRPALSDFNVTLAFGLATFIIIIVLGLLHKGPKRLLHYVNPLYTLTDVVVPVSVALRIFGSVFSGYLIMHLIYNAILPYQVARFILPVLLPVVGSVMFTIFHAVIQSYVYMFLSMSLINEATE